MRLKRRNKECYWQIGGDGAMKENRSSAMVRWRRSVAQQWCDVRRSKDSDWWWCDEAMVGFEDLKIQISDGVGCWAWERSRAWDSEARLSERVDRETEDEWAGDVWTGVESIEWIRTGLYTRSGRVDRILEGKTRHSTRRNRFGMARTRHQPPGSRVGQFSVWVRSVWPGASGLRFC